MKFCQILNQGKNMICLVESSIDSDIDEHQKSNGFIVKMFGGFNFAINFRNKNQNQKLIVVPINTKLSQF